MHFYRTFTHHVNMKLYLFQIFTIIITYLALLLKFALALGMASNTQTAEDEPASNITTAQIPT